MEIKHIPFENLPFSTLFEDYINQKSTISQFFESNPFTTPTKIQLEAVRRDKEQGLLIESFNSSFDLPEKTKQNIDSLKKGLAYTVVTGQQIGLFGGFSYTVYKIISAIKLANDWSEELNAKVIPIFWIADEDHDFEEANHLWIQNEDSFSKIRVNRTSELSQQVGRELLGNEIVGLINKYLESYNTLHTEDIHDLLKRVYQPGKSQKDAFIELIYQCFPNTGLICYGSDFKEIKSYSKSVLKTSITQADKIGDLLEKTSIEIEKVYKRQVTVDKSTLFLNTESGRERLHKSETGLWYTNSKEFNENELLNLLERSPESFSPNVFLRPIIQDYILPNLAYVAGPGEIAYYAQMKDFYSIFNMKMPAIVPRFSCTIIDKPVSRFFNELPFQFEELFKRFEQLIISLLSEESIVEVDEIIDSWKASNTEALRSRLNYIQNLDSTLVHTAAGITEQFQNMLENLNRKMIRALKRKESDQIARLRKVYDLIYPAEHLQERFLPFIFFMNRHGLSLWENIISQSDSLSFQNHNIITLKD